MLPRVSTGLASDPSELGYKVKQAIGTYTGIIKEVVPNNADLPIRHATQSRTPGPRGSHHVTHDMHPGAH